MTEENLNNLENNEIPKTTPEKVEQQEISQEEFLNWLDNEGNNFKQETQQELDKANSIDLDQPTFEKIKNDTGVENDLNAVNLEAEGVIADAKSKLTQLNEEKRNIFQNTDSMSIEDITRANQRLDQIKTEQENLNEKINGKGEIKKDNQDVISIKQEEQKMADEEFYKNKSEELHNLNQEARKNHEELDFSPLASKKRKQSLLDSQPSNVNINENGEFVDFTEEQIKNTESLSQLYRELDKIAGIQGSEKFYSSEDLKDGIHLFVNNKMDPSFLPNTYGFRDKVIELKNKQRESEYYKSLGIEKLSKEELYVDRIKHSVDMRDLVSRIITLGDITAPDGYVYKKDDIITNITNLKDINDPNLQKITNTHGLRDKVKELIIKRRQEDV